MALELVTCATRATLLHNVAAPSLKFIVPVGMTPPLAGVTVPVSVTLWPNTDGLADEDNAVPLAAAFTIRLPGALLLPAKLALDAASGV